MSWLEFFADLSSSLGWPVAVVLVGLLAKQALPDVWKRIHKVGPSGIELYPHPGDQTKGLIETKDGLENTKLEPLTDPTAADVEAKLKEDLGEFEANQREPILLRALTNSMMSTSFSLVYANIFGSQIRTLELLNSRSVDEREAEELFYELKSENEIFRDWTLGQYLNFLLHWKLIERVDAAYHITITGRSFLQFLVHKGLSKERLH